MITTIYKGKCTFCNEEVTHKTDVLYFTCNRCRQSETKAMRFCKSMHRLDFVYGRERVDEMLETEGVDKVFIGKL